MPLAFGGAPPHRNEIRTSGTFRPPENGAQDPSIALPQCGEVTLQFQICTASENTERSKVNEYSLVDGRRTRERKRRTREDKGGDTLRSRLDSLVVRAPGLEHGLVGPASAGDDANHGAAVGADRLLGAGGEAELGGALVLVVGDEDGVVAGAAGEGAAVADLGLDGGADSTLGHHAQGHDVAHGEGGWLQADV